jgi:hypothetical protein
MEKYTIFYVLGWFVITTLFAIFLDKNKEAVIFRYSFTIIFGIIIYYLYFIKIK